jgi:hypothetical protein
MGQRERPIIFSAPMVRAILDGRKTQTRRKMKPQLEFRNLIDGNSIIIYSGWVLPNKSGYGGTLYPNAATAIIESCPYGVVGDRLWVRETWGIGSRPDMHNGWRDGIELKADEGEGDDDLLPLYSAPAGVDVWGMRPGWRSPIHMPRWASRITLEITDVRVQRLQDITVADAQAEGADPIEHGVPDARNAYSAIWESINGPGSWDANPWVWALTFKPIPVSTRSSQRTDGDAPSNQRESN